MLPNKQEIERKIQQKGDTSHATLCNSMMELDQSCKDVQLPMKSLDHECKNNKNQNVEFANAISVWQIGTSAQRI